LNSGSKNSSTQRIKDRLAGHKILITGSTGFLAKAFVEKLLRSVDTIDSLYLLVRPRAGGASPAQRVKRDVLGSPAFDRLRASLGDRFSELCDRKIHVVNGDLTRERLGLSPDDYASLTKTITLVVNSAATVTFDERLDLAVDLNTLGPSRLLRFAKDGGGIPFLHVSTCYVSGQRSGDIVEDFTAPETAREKLPRDQESGEYDLDSLVQSLQAQAQAVRHRLGADTEACRKELIDLGMATARSFGWNDTYTFTKWIGEQLLVRDHGSIPLTIFRPAIIESSYEEPAPGWIDGLRMADPMLIGYGKGKLGEFPGCPELPLDLIPADFVANGMIATLPVGDERPEGVALYQCASSAAKPLILSSLSRYLQRAYKKRPMLEDGKRLTYRVPFQLVPTNRFLKQLARKQKYVTWLRKLFEKFHAGRRRVRKYNGILRQLEQLAYFAKIYTPYTHLDCRFVVDALDAVAEKLHPDDRAEFPFNVKAIDWEDYIVNRHIPGVRSFVLGIGSEPSGRIASELANVDTSVAKLTLQTTSLFDVLQRVAEQYPDKHAIQIKRENRWLRFTYKEVLQTTGTIMQRFQERGLVPGDRVAISGVSSPEWGISYFAVMRAGLTAVPLDPQLPPNDVWAATRYAKVKLILAGPSTHAALAGSRADTDAEIILMSRPFIPPPGASRGEMPAPVISDGNDIASILFTSGTTVAPKAVPLTHRNFLANASALVDVHPIFPNDELLSVLPMYHAFEFTGGFIVPLACGATITYLDQVKGAQIKAAMHATGTTVMLVVPRFIRMLHGAITGQVAAAGRVKRNIFRLLGWLSDKSGRRFGSTLFAPVHKSFGGRLRMFVSGASRLDPELFESFQRMGFDVYEGYGLTETSPVLSVNPPSSALMGSVGPMLSNVDAEVRNQNADGIGEVWVRGPSVMSGYLDNPEATDEIIQQGWLRTGDLGRFDSRGYLYLTGRSKDLIITPAGKNVYPDEVEARYREVPFVKELCVFGMASEEGSGDAVHAVIVVDRGAGADHDRSSIEREIRMSVEEISESIPSHQRLAVLHFWDREIPKTTTLKAKRNLVRDMVQQECDAPTTARGKHELSINDGDEDQSMASQNPAVFEAVQQILASQTKMSPEKIRRPMHLLLDLGLDSIGKIDVIGTVEARFDMRIDEEKSAQISRVSDILSAIGDRTPKSSGTSNRNIWQRRLTQERSSSDANGSLAAPLLPVRWIVRGGVKVFMNTYVRVIARGCEHIPSLGSFILAPNHASHLDTPSVLTAVGSKRRVWVAGAEDYFFSSPTKRFLFGKILDTIPVDRQADGLRGLKLCGDTLRRGDGLLIFPEGTRSVNGSIQPFKIGAAVLAMERGVPIIPVHIDRAYDLFPKGQRLIHPGSVTVTFGQAIVPPPLDETSDHYACFQEMIAAVEASVVRMRDGAPA